MHSFRPKCRPMLIGSLPLDDHSKASDLVFDYTPEIPLWVQLPVHKEEGMMVQFLSGLPGIGKKSDDPYIDTGTDAFDTELLAFYEEYVAVTEGEISIDDTRFVLNENTAKGFFVFLEQLETHIPTPNALKCQITGPMTLGMGTKDQDGRAIIYNSQVMDTIVKLVAQKARWQVLKLQRFNRPVIVFFDEPALAGFGSSAFIGISRDEVDEKFEEVIRSVHEMGALAGIHVCANTDWSVILDSSADIVSFDAYSYFDKFILYAQKVKDFIDRGGLLAWGIVPTSSVEDIEREETDFLIAKFYSQIQQVMDLGIDKSTLFSQIFITPSCGTGVLNLSHTQKVLRLTKNVSNAIIKRL